MKRAQPIGKILAGLLRDLGLAKKLNEQKAVVEWGSVVGRDIAEHSRALKVDGGRLVVEVDSPVWSQELTLMKRDIMRRLNDRAGEGAIDNIHFVLGGATTHGASGRNSREEGHGQG